MFCVCVCVLAAHARAHTYIFIYIYASNRDICKTEELKTFLNSGASVKFTKPLVERKVESLDPGHVILFGCGLDKQEHKQLVTLTQQLKLRMVQSCS